MEASALPVPAGLTPGVSLGLPLRMRSDEQLLALFRAGNEDAFRAIHDRYRQRLFAYTRQMLPGSLQDAEDALQDVFVRAYFNLRADDRQLALRAWLYRVAHNRCVDQLRRPPQAPPEALEPLRGQLSDPLAVAEQREALRRLVQDVRRLPDQQRSALLMRELSGMSYLELAQALGTSVPAVKSLLVRARIGLAQAAHARDAACSEIRQDLADAHERGIRATGNARRHLRDCAACREFRGTLRGVSRQLAALAPLGPAATLAKVLGLGGGGAASGAAASGTAGSSVAGGTFAAGGVLAGGAGHAAALLAAAALAAGGAVELSHPPSTSFQPKHAPAALEAHHSAGPTGPISSALAIRGTVAAAAPVVAAITSTIAASDAADEAPAARSGEAPTGASTTAAGPVGVSRDAALTMDSGVGSGGGSTSLSTTAAPAGLAGLGGQSSVGTAPPASSGDGSASTGADALSSGSDAISTSTPTATGAGQTPSGAAASSTGGVKSGASGSASASSASATSSAGATSSASATSGTSSGAGGNPTTISGSSATASPSS